MDRGGLAAPDVDVVRLDFGAAFANDLGPQRVDVGLAELEFGGEQRTTLGEGVRRHAVNGQTGIGREGNDDRGRSRRLNAALGLLDLFTLLDLFLRQNL